jgi:glutamate carboxypeptidase
MISKHRRLPSALLAVVMAVAAGPSLAEPVAAIQDLAKQEQQPLLDTLRDLVSIESGSKDLEGLAKIRPHRQPPEAARRQGRADPTG